MTLAATVLERAGEKLGDYLPRLAGALAVLVVGVIVAAILARLVRAGCGGSARTRWRNAWPHDALQLAGLGRSLSGVIAGAVRWMLYAIVAFAVFAVLGPLFLTDPLTAPSFPAEPAGRRGSPPRRRRPRQRRPCPARAIGDADEPGDAGRSDRADRRRLPCSRSARRRLHLDEHHHRARGDPARRRGDHPGARLRPRRARRRARRERRAIRSRHAARGTGHRGRRARRPDPDDRAHRDGPRPRRRVAVRVPNGMLLDRVVVILEDVEPLEDEPPPEP